MIQKTKIYEGTAQDRYQVHLLTDEWPADEILIDYCDSDNLGGYVGEKMGKSCVVTIYKD